RADRRVQWWFDRPAAGRRRSDALALPDAAAGRPAAAAARGFGGRFADLLRCRPDSRPRRRPVDRSRCLAAGGRNVGSCAPGRCARGRLGRRLPALAGDDGGGARPERQSRRRRMSQAAVDRYDLFVIGGGINGAAVACDAAGRGLAVGLAEMCDFAEGTSSRSSELIHGGLRYLETYDFRLVRDALREREVLMARAPPLVWP